MAWQSIGSVSVGPGSGEQVIGLVSVSAMNGIEVRHQLTSPDRGFRFAYGILSYISPIGRELGTMKIYPNSQVTGCRLGAGLTAIARTGNLTFDPRSYNLRWVEAGFPLSMSFWADVPEDLPEDRYKAPGIQDALGNLLRLVGVGTQGRLQF